MTNARTPTAHTHPAADLGSGTPAAGKYLDGAGAWTTLPTGSPGGLAALTDVDTPRPRRSIVARSTTTRFTGKFKGRVPDVYNVKDFGAIGDGNTNPLSARFASLSRGYRSFTRS
jgi:hypothetical protein